MKIFTFIRTYAAPETPEGSLLSARSASNARSREAYYTMQESTVLRSSNPFFVPDFDKEFRAYPSLCLRIGRLGKGIAPRFAHRYFESWTMAAAVIATDTLKSLREQGEPWSAAVSFDRSCWLGNLQPIDTLLEYDTFEVECGDTRHTYDVSKITPAKEELISILSRDNTLKNGDLILAALDPRGITLTPGQHLKISSKTKGIELTDIKIR